MSPARRGSVRPRSGLERGEGFPLLKSLWSQAESLPEWEVCLLVFSLLYTPCVAAIASIKKELGAKWAAGVVVWQCVIIWVFAVLAQKMR